MSRTSHHWLDGAALGASALCLAHCLALPLLIIALPALAGLTDIDEGVHRAIFAFAVPASLPALILGHRRHGHLSPPLGGVLGLVFLACALRIEQAWLETAVTLAGSALLASAHLANWRMRARTG